MWLWKVFLVQLKIDGCPRAVAYFSLNFLPILNVSAHILIVVRKGVFWATALMQYYCTVFAIVDSLKGI